MGSNVPVSVDTNIHVSSKDVKQYLRGGLEGREVDVRHDGTRLTVLPELDSDEYLDLMDQTSVRQAVLVSGVWVYGYDNSYAADCAARHPERFASVGNFDGLHPDVVETMNYWVTERGVHAVRFYGNSQVEEPVWLDDPRIVPAWQHAAELRVPIDMARLSQATIPKLRPLLERFPEVPTIISFLGHPFLEDGPPYVQAKELFSLAEFPNAYAKIAPGNILQASKGKSTPKAFFELLVERFGSRRLMWSSYYRGGGSYGEIVDLIRSTFSFLGENDQRWILGETARSLYPSLRSAVEI